MKDREPYALLKTKEIIAILDGDTDYGTFEFEDGTSVKVAMPYLSGPDLCGISTMFGLPATYTWGGVNLSRWQYLDDLMDYCLKQGRFSDLLAYLFAKERFSKVLSGRGANEIDTAYNHIISTIQEKINGVLIFGGNELATIGNRFVVRRIGSKVNVQVPKIKTIDREYIKSISSRAMEDVAQNNFDSAITKSRTLLEEIFCYVIEKKGDTPSDSGDMGKLFKHGVGAKRIAIDEHHARLFVNSAMTLADFILSVEEKANNAK